ncbi:MAG: hypothetical protein ACT4PV_09255 [Planctomycetaceae bacterium]
MRSRSALFLGMALFACGEEKAPEADARVTRLSAAALDAGVAELVPTDAAFVVRASSAARLARVATWLQSEAGIPLPSDPAAALAGMMNLQPGLLDADRPLYLCATLAGPRVPPVLTLLAPVTDSKAVAGRHPAAATASGYVSLTAGEAPASGGSKLAAGLMDGDVSIRVDCTRVVSAFRNDIDWFFDVFPMLATEGATAEELDPGAGEFFEGMVAWMHVVVDGAETLDVVLHERDGLYDVQLALTAREGSALDGGTPAKSRLKELAAHLPSDMPFTLLLRCDLEGLMNLSMPMMAAVGQTLAAEERSAIQDHLDRYVAMTKLLGNEAALGLDTGASGMRMAVAMGAEQPDQYVKAYTELCTGGLPPVTGMTFHDEGARDAGATKVQRLRMAIDIVKYEEFIGLPPSPLRTGVLEAMFGEDGVLFELAAKDGRVLMAAGGDAVMATVLAAKGPPPWIEAATAGIRGELTFLCRVELRAFLRGIGDALRDAFPGETMKVAKGGEVPVLLWGSVDGRVYRAGATLNLARIKTLVD